MEMSEQGQHCWDDGHWGSSREVNATDKKGQHCPDQESLWWSVTASEPTTLPRNRSQTDNEAIPSAHQQCIQTYAQCWTPRGNDVHEFAMKHAPKRFADAKGVASPCGTKPCVPWRGFISEAGWAVLPCAKVESLSLMQLLILLTIRRTSWKSEPAFMLRPSALRLALYLFKKSWVNVILEDIGMSAESWPTALGPQDENGETTGESVIGLRQFFLSLSPSWPSGLLQMCHVSLIELQTQTTSSYITFLHHQAGAAQESPLCSLKHVLTAPWELGDHLTHRRRQSFSSLLLCLCFLSLGCEFPPLDYPFDLLYFCTSEHLESVFVPLISTWKFQCFPEEK